MTVRNRKGTAPVLSDAIKTQLAQSMVPIRRDEVILYRGKERSPILTVRRPAFGTFLVHAARQIRTCAKKRNLETDLPPALRIHKTAVSGYFTGEPLAKFDPNAADQYELKWDDTKTTASVNLLPILQPRNMEVSDGYVMEVPVSLEVLNNAPFLVLHLGDAHTRAEQEGPPRKKKDAAAKTADAISSPVTEGEPKPVAAQLPEE